MDYDEGTLNTLQSAFQKSKKLKDYKLEILTECRDVLEYIRHNDTIAVVCEYMMWDENGKNIPYGIKFLEQIRDERPEINRGLCFDPEYTESMYEELSKDLAMLIAKPLMDRSEVELKILKLAGKR